MIIWVVPGYNGSRGWGGGCTDQYWSVELIEVCICHCSRWWEVVFHTGLLDVKSVDLLDLIQWPCFYGVQKALVDIASTSPSTTLYMNQRAVSNIAWFQLCWSGYDWAALVTLLWVFSSLNAAWRQAYILYSLRVLFLFFATLGRWCLLTDVDMFQLLSHCSSIFRSYLQIYGVSNWEQILLLYRMISANSLVKHFGQFAEHWCASHWCWWGTGSRQRESPSFIH